MSRSPTPVRSRLAPICNARKCRKAVRLNAAVPSPGAFTVKVHAVRNGDPGKIFGVLVAELTRDAKANGGAVAGRQWFTIHAVSQQRLPMKDVRHVDAVP